MCHFYVLWWYTKSVHYIYIYIYIQLTLLVYSCFFDFFLSHFSCPTFIKQVEAVKERDRCLEIAENKIQQQQHQLLEQQIQLHALNASPKVSLPSIYRNCTTFIPNWHLKNLLEFIINIIIIINFFHLFNFRKSKLISNLHLKNEIK